MAMDSRELDSPLADLDGLPCDVRDLHDDLHIQAAVVGSDRDSPGSLKRAGCDLGADGDLGTAKKRRKQSKPVRIDAGEGAAALGDALAEVLGDVVDNGGDPRVSPSLDLEVQVHCQTEGEARDEIPLNLCSLPKTEPSSPTGLDDFGTFPTHAGLKSVSPGGGLDMDLAVQHQQSERMAMNNFWGMSPPFLYPMMAPQSEQGLSQGMPQGLQQGLPQGLQQGLQQGLPPGLPQGLPQGLQQGLPPGLSQGLSQGLPQSLTQSNNHQSRCSPDNRTGSCTIFNPDAYCELCNKEFCNKYFLKTHKANKHGIFTNSPSQVPTQQQQLQQLQQQPQQPPQPPQPSPQQQQQSSPSSNDTYQHGLLPPRTLSPNSDSHVKLSSSPLRLQKDLISAKHGKNLFQRKIKVKSFGSNGEDVSLPPVVKVEDEYYDTDMDRLLSRMSPLQSADGLREDAPAVPKVAVQEDLGEGGSAGDSNESTGILRKEAVPPQEILDKPVFTPEKMRSLGVINPEAFCEICCKEYCNKYFLRTHKWKRHGIAPPEGEQDKQEAQRPPAPSWLQQLQQHAAPLNLIMEEATNQGDAICKFCGQWFPSEQVLQVHVAFVHMTKKQDKEGGDPADMRKEPLEDKRGGERSKQMAPEQIESIMDDMKKVQTMLFQLNTLNNQLPGVAGEQGKRSPGAADEPRSGESPVNGGLPCAICKKTLPDKAALQQHVQEQHWSAPIKVERDVDVTPVPPGREAAAEQPQQQQQQQQQPQPPPPPPPQPAEPKPTAPTSSYCEICNKELCNKYFMKTHMQRMHGIEIENGSQIGGVVCDICNKELCSKYFLRVHKQNTHGIVDETNGPPTQVRGDGGAGGLFSGSHFLDAGSQALKPTDLSEMSHRYFTHFNEVCSICNRRFRSVKWLKAHLMNDHGRSEYEAAAEANDRLPKLQPGLHPSDLGVQLGLGPGLLQGPGGAGPRERARGEGKARHGRAQDGGGHAAKNGNHFMSNLMQVAGTSSKEYRCSYCPFSTPVLAFLYVHEKTHTGLAYMPEQKRELQCPICFKTCTKPEQFQRHLLSHQFAGLPGPGGLPGALWDPRNSVYAGHHKEPKREKQLPPPQPAAPRGTPERDEDGVDVDERVRFAEPARHREAPTPTEAKRSGKCPACGGDLAPGERCGACGGGGKELSSLQSLLKETVTSDVKKRLEDAAKLNDIPATYAVPKTQDSDADPFIMQPFIIEEPRGEEGSLGVVGGAPPVDKKFVPSLVFLPVKERLSRPLTASFTLTPA